MSSMTILPAKGVTARKVAKYEVFSGPYFPVFSLNTGKYGQEKSPYLHSFRAVLLFNFCLKTKSTLTGTKKSRTKKTNIKYFPSNIRKQNMNFI